MERVLSTPQSSDFSLSRELELEMTPPQRSTLPLALGPLLPTYGYGIAGSSNDGAMVALSDSPLPPTSSFVASPITVASSPSTTRRHRSSTRAGTRLETAPNPESQLPRRKTRKDKGQSRAPRNPK